VVRPFRQAGEEYLTTSIAVVSCSALVKHQKAVAAEQARLRQEAALRRKLEEERKQREQKRRNFLTNKAESYAQYILLSDFAAHFRREAKADGADPIDKMARVLDVMLRYPLDGGRHAPLCRRSNGHAVDRR
jgi:hypothetical protein